MRPSIGYSGKDALFWDGVCVCVCGWGGGGGLRRAHHETKYWLLGEGCYFLGWGGGGLMHETKSFFFFFYIYKLYYPRNNNKYGGVRDGALISPPYTCIMYSHTMHY